MSRTLVGPGVTKPGGDPASPSPAVTFLGIPGRHLVSHHPVWGFPMILVLAPSRGGVRTEGEEGGGGE
eukprot:8393387-Pyramimonas_sp.AAC.1